MANSNDIITSSTAANNDDDAANNSGNNLLHHYDPDMITRYIQFYKNDTDEQHSHNDNNSNNNITTNPPPPKKKKTKRTSKKHIPPKVLEIRRQIQFCCKNNDLITALSLFRTALLLQPPQSQQQSQPQQPVKLEPQTFYNLMNLCDGSFGNNGDNNTIGRVHVGTPKISTTTTRKTLQRGDGHDDHHDDSEDGQSATKAKGTSPSLFDGLNNSSNTTINNNKTNYNSNNLTPHQRLNHARQIHSLLTQLNIPCIEPAYTALIRLSVRVGNYSLAEEFLNEAERTSQCKVKLRMYSSLLRGYCGDSFTAAGDDDDDDDSGGGSSSTRGGVPPTQEGLIKALKVWKRMYDNSGGISTGHPRYHHHHYAESSNTTSKQDGSTTTTTMQQQQQQQLLLFGEGVSPKISLSEYEYSALLKCATALRDVKVAERVLSDVAESVMVPGLSTVEVILDWFRSDTNNNAAVVAAAAAISLKTDDIDGERRCTITSSSTSSSSALDQDDVILPPREGEGVSIGPVTNDTGGGWNIYRNCTIDPSTGVLHLCNPEVSIIIDGATTTTSNSSKSKQQMIEYRLKPVELTQKAWKAMREMNSSIVLEGTVEGNISPFQGGGKGKKRPRGSDVISKLHDGNDQQGSFAHKNNSNNSNNSNNNNNNNNNNHKTGRKMKDPNWRINHWKEFETFIENHPPYNVVIDGANVGYYNQTYRLGSNAPRHVDYKQIDGLIRHLLELPCSERYHIILFMHERHFSPKLLPQWAYPIIKLWDGNEAPYDRLTVYRTPQGLNDDWYWMHAALINGGREDRPSVLAITNDEMRDHHFQMTAQGYFLRWKERHQVHFDFGDWNRDLKRNDVLLEYPSIYSRRIQRVDGESMAGVVTGADAIVIPLPKKGDENRFVDGVHVADVGIPEEETYVVIQRVCNCLE
ncbi:hypothetical protein ACHAXM_004374 [Skeletonema potamos]